MHGLPLTENAGIFKNAKKSIVKIQEDHGKIYVLELLESLCGSDIEKRDSALNILMVNLGQELNYEQQFAFTETILNLITSFCSYAYVIIHREMFSEKVGFEISDLQKDLLTEKTEMEVEPLEKIPKN